MNSLPTTRWCINWMHSLTGIRNYIPISLIDSLNGWACGGNYDFDDNGGWTDISSLILTVPGQYVLDKIILIRCIRFTVITIIKYPDTKVLNRFCLL